MGKRVYFFIHSFFNSLISFKRLTTKLTYNENLRFGTYHCRH